MRRTNPGLAIVVIALFIVAGAIVGTAAAQKNEVERLLLLVDANKNGKISKQEFMKFMEAEFDRLDKDNSGELDVKELAISQVRASRPAVGK